MHEPARRQPFSAKQTVAMLLCAGIFFAQVFRVFAADDEKIGLQRELQAARLVETAVLAKKSDGSATREELEKVTGIYAEIAKRHPGDADALDARADFFWKIDRCSEAMAEWEKAETLAPANAEIVNHLGGCHLALGNAKRATEYFERAAMLDPKNALYHFNAGNTCFLFRREMADAKNDADAVMRCALEHFRQASQLEPFNVDYARAYAETSPAFSNPDWEVAMQAWQHYFEITGSKNFALANLARVNLKLGREKEARGNLAGIKGPKFDALKEKILRKNGAK